MSRQIHSDEICLQVDDLLDAYALDALEPSERDLVDQHIDTCSRQRDRLAELNEVVLVIGRSAAGVAPPVAVWQRLLVETNPTRPVVLPVPEVDAARERLTVISRANKVVTLNRWVAWAGAAAAAVLLASTVSLGVALQRDDGAEVPQDPVVEMVARGGQVVALSTQPQPAAISEVGQGSILTAPGMTPAVVVYDWTPSNAALHYIVWMAAASGEAPTVLGEITIDRDGHGVLVLSGVTTFEGYGIFGISIQTTPDAGLQDVLLGTPPVQTG